MLWSSQLSIATQANTTHQVTPQPADQTYLITQTAPEPIAMAGDTDLAPGAWRPHRRPGRDPVVPPHPDHHQGNLFWAFAYNVVGLPLAAACSTRCSPAPRWPSARSSSSPTACGSAASVPPPDPIAIGHVDAVVAISHGPPGRRRA
jgi:hypothetical protein